jgi:predicted metal-binding membrane protein
VSTATARAWGPPPLVVAAISGAWALAIIVETTGNGAALHHDTLIEGGPPLWAALLLFLVGWQAMIAAMMLPSSLPLIRLFDRVSSAQPNPARVRLAFLGGYALVWTSFGAVGFVGDVGVHRTVDSWPWLAQHSFLIAGGVLVLAGAFQFSDLKDRCLRQCRAPGLFLMRHYQRGSGAALHLGARHGIFCLGCCWALMLVGFAAGVANLAWMAALTAIMVFEKTGPTGDRGVAPIGVALLALGALVLAHPAWLPSVVGV